MKALAQVSRKGVSRLSVSQEFCVDVDAGSLRERRPPIDKPRRVSELADCPPLQLWSLDRFSFVLGLTVAADGQPPRTPCVP